MSVIHLSCLCVCVCDSADCVRCFARFDLNTGECNEEIGEVDEDDCCQNPDYGYMETDGQCESCG